VRRSANALADRLANEGVNQEGKMLDEAWTQIPVGQLRTDCEHLATQDHRGSNREDNHIDGNECHMNLEWDPDGIGETIHMAFRPHATI
jgi:hypothetical protein